MSNTNENASGASTQTTPAQQAEKVTFTEQQQRRVDEIMKEFLGRTGQEEREEVESLREKLEAMKANPDNRLTNLEAELQKRDSEIAALRMSADTTQAARAVERAALRALGVVARGAGYVILPQSQNVAGEFCQWDDADDFTSTMPPSWLVDKFFVSVEVAA